MAGYPYLMLTASAAKRVENFSDLIIVRAAAFLLFLPFLWEFTALYKFFFVFFYFIFTFLVQLCGFKTLRRVNMDCFYFTRFHPCLLSLDVNFVLQTNVRESRRPTIGKWRWVNEGVVDRL